MAVLESLVGAKTPGLQYLALNARGIIHEYAGGWADVARRRPMTPDTTLSAYSMSKTLTAVGVLLLDAEGTLRIDDPVRRYLPSHPYSPELTVRQLISHTGGVPNPLPLRWVHPVSDSAFDDCAEMVRMLVRHGRFKAEPGQRFAYSNLGYWMLGGVVEHVSGMPFPEFMRRRVLEPLGIPADDLGYGIPDLDRHAQGYLEKYSMLNLVKRLVIDRSLIGGYEGSWLRIEPHVVNGAAFGGLVGNCRGFGRFLRDALLEEPVLPVRAKLFEQQRTRAGTLIPMTLGWHVGQLGSAKHYFKEGGGCGFHCMMRIYPEAGVATVAMVNATQFHVRECLDQVDRQWM